MTILKNTIKKVVISIILTSILLSYICMPSANAKLNIGENEFYYSGTTSGSLVEKKSVVKWLVEKLADVVDYVLGVMTMGGRMVFVGWTALAEHVLTWFLETASGVNLNGEDISSTDLTALGDSSKNVTVQAIVYNRVPALNVNFFKFKTTDLFRDGDNYISPTGQILKCNKCRKPVQECCTNLPSSPEDIKLEDNYCNTGGEDGCKCNGKCSGCRTYKAMRQQESTMPMIALIKKAVAIWYNIIAVLSYAIMLVVLIALGIKSAISSLAGEKALYKSMLFDWVVGMALIASVQMIMYFAITLNEMAVGIVAKSADEVNKVQIMHMTEKDPDELNSNGNVTLSDQEIELNVYEAIRTRAYDAKLTVGMSGMIMYITLVYYAFRYTFMYLRRLFNLAVLTIMGPAIGVSYAVQKILHGKGISFKNWLQEYLLTLFIQIIHAILYGVFISEALVFSLKSVAGMIFALVLMHYAFRMDKLFRKIFNFGEGGIMKDMDSAGDLSQKRKDLKALRGALIGGGAATSLVMNSPYSNAVKTIGRTAGSAVLMGTAGISTGFSTLVSNISSANAKDTGLEDQDDTDDTNNSSPDLNVEGNAGDDAGIGGTFGNASSGASGSDSSPLENALKEKRAENQKKEDEDLINSGRDRLREELEAAGKALEDNPDAENYERYQEAQRKLARYDELVRENSKSYATSAVIAGKISQIFNVSTYVKYGKGKNGKNVLKFKTDKASTGNKFHGLKAGSQMLFGSQRYDFATGKIVKNNDAAIDNLRISNLLNLSTEDKKMLKENIGKPLVQGLGGMASMFMGMATFVENPLLGMSLLAAGYSNKEKSFKTLGVRRRDRKYNGRYTFDSFNVAATKNICDSAIKLSEKDRDKMMIEHLKKCHRKLYLEMKKELEKAKAKGADIKVSGNYVDGFTYSTDDIDALKNSKSGLSVGTLAKLESGKSIFIPASVLSERYISETTAFMDKLDSDTYGYYANPKYMSNKQLKNDIFKKGMFFVGRSPRATYANANKGRRVGKGLHDIYEYHYKKVKDEEKQAEKDKLDLMKNASIAQVNLKFRKLYEAQEASELANLGYKKDGDKFVKNPGENDELSKEARKLSSADIANLEKTIDNIIREVAGGKQLDLNSEKVLNDIIKKMDAEFYASNYIEYSQSADSLFSGGISGLKSTIKKRGLSYNKTVSSLERDLKGYKKEDQELIISSFKEALENKHSENKKYSNDTADQVLQKMRAQYKKGNQTPDESGNAMPTEEEVQKFVRSIEIIDKAKRNARSGKNSQFQKKEVDMAEEFLNSLSDTTRESMQSALDEVINAPVTEKEVRNVMAKKLQESGRSDSVDSILGALGDGIKKVVGKMSSSLKSDLSEQDVKRLMEKYQKSSSKSMLDMVNLVYMGNTEEAVSQIEASSDSEDIKRKKLDALLTFERQVETLEAINDYALENQDRLKLKTAGSAGHKELKKEVNDESLEVTRQKLEVAKFERVHGSLERINFQSLSDSDKLEYRRIKSIKDRIAFSEQNLNKKKEKLRKNGPISDVEKDLITNNKVINKN